LFGQLNTFDIIFVEVNLPLSPIMQHSTTTENNNKRLERWKITLSEYKYDIIYQKGTKHANADAFSYLDSTLINNHTNPSTSYNDHVTHFYGWYN
jgi:hypothetical protein